MRFLRHYQYRATREHGRGRRLSHRHGVLDSSLHLWGHSLFDVWRRVHGRQRVFRERVGTLNTVVQTESGIIIQEKPFYNP